MSAKETTKMTFEEIRKLIDSSRDFCIKLSRRSKKKSTKRFKKAKIRGL